MVGNLFDNAVNYSEEDGSVDVRAWMDGESAAVEICNTMNGNPADLKRHVFDRFWRGDRSRVGTEVHSGLGLPLCRQAAVALGAQLSVCVGEGSFTAILKLRVSEADSSVKVEGVASLGKGGRR